MYNREFRLRAWNALRGRWNVFYPIMLLSVVFADAFGLKIIYVNFFSRTLPLPMKMLGQQVTYGLPIPYGIGCVLAGIALAFTLCGMAINTGEYRLSKAVADHNELRAGMLFPRNVFFKALAMNLLQYLLIALGSMFFVIPGIVFACNYAMANYLLANDPTLGPIEVLRKSREMMYGKRLAFFSLQMSFLPWALGIYLVLSATASAIANLTWQGDVIYSIVSWTTTAFLLGYMRVTSFYFFRECESAAGAGFTRNAWTARDNSAETNIPNPEKEAREQAAREAEQRRANEAAAEALYYRYSCSHNALAAAGELDRYRALELSEYRENVLRTQYGRELMIRFDSDPGVFDRLIDLCEEYAMDGLIDRTIARLYRYDREQNIPPEQLLSMVASAITALSVGAFSEDPGFAARKRTDLLKLADSVRAGHIETAPEGPWRDRYREICDLCGIEEA